MHVTMSTPASVLAADTTARTMTGVVVPYGQAGNTSAGRLTVRAGAVRVPDNLRQIKLLRDHDRTRPVGYALTATDTPAGLVMSFRVGATSDGDQALLEATEGLRDAFSVELDDLELDGQTVTAAALTAVAQVPVPAYQAARIAQVAAARPPADPPADPTPAPDPAPDPGPVPADDDDDDDDSTDDESENDMTVTATDARPAAAAARPLPTTSTTTRPRGVTTYLEAARVIAATARGELTPAELQAALNDVTTKDTSAGPALPPQWVGNLWADDPLPRVHVDAITGPRPLTGLKVTGFVWETGLHVMPWAGDKAAIPTNIPKATPGEATAKRWAGGVDVAREFVDLGSPEIIADLLATARDDYNAKTDADVLNELTSFGTDVGMTFADGLEVVSAVLGEFRGKGRLSTLFIGANVWASLAGLSGQNLLTGALSFAGGDIGGVSFVYDGDLMPNTALGVDKRAATFYERGPITVEALNIAQGGIDEAVHGYTATLINNPAYVVTASMVPPVADAASSRKSASK